MPDEVTSFLVDGVALVIAFSLLMLVLTPAIRRRDELLADYMVCEREVVLMDDRLHVPRSSRRFEYVMATLAGAAADAVRRGGPRICASGALRLPVAARPVGRP